LKGDDSNETKESQKDSGCSAEAKELVEEAARKKAKTVNERETPS
jgi:hypothetical protein